jgi:hypothetical protein
MLAMIELFNQTVISNKNILQRHTADVVARASILLFLCMFEEMHLTMLSKSIIKKEKYNLKFSPSFAVAFWIEFNGKLPETTQIGNVVQMMCNEIHKQILSK